jgi:hypothetical protein
LLLIVPGWNKPQIHVELTHILYRDKIDGIILRIKHREKICYSAVRLTVRPVPGEAVSVKFKNSAPDSSSLALYPVELYPVIYN